ncbi:MAG: GFA family protein [Kofleriaceae bacterium]|nr:GFA family protein [Kofleriaceae bacterium]
MPAGWLEARCHCGGVRLAVRGRPASVLICNCSICARKGYLHWIVPVADTRLLTDAAALATYGFGTGVARHHFCPRCGCAPFYVPRSDPDKVDVNLRCVDGVDLEALPLRTFDGRDWERSFVTYAARRDRGDDPDVG